MCDNIQNIENCNKANSNTPDGPVKTLEDTAYSNSNVNRETDDVDNEARVKRRKTNNSTQVKVPCSEEWNDVLENTKGNVKVIEKEKNKSMNLAPNSKLKNNTKSQKSNVKIKAVEEGNSKETKSNTTYTTFFPQQVDKQSKRKRLPASNNQSSNANLPSEVPIFTTEFLEHNKNLDMELRALRKSKIDLEQHNAVLEKHVENMKLGVEKLTTENDELEEKNRLLERYLEKLKSKLANALGSLAIPTEPNGATIENIDKYMDDLFKMTTSNTHGPACLNKARDIIRKLDLQIQL